MSRALGLTLAFGVSLGGAAALLTLLDAGDARAGESGFDPRVAEAKTACAAGDATKAIRVLAELYTETNDPIWIFNQGRCYHQNGLLSQALSRFKEFLRKSADSPPEDIRDAEGFIREIEADLRKQEEAGRAPVAVVPAGPGAASADEHPGRGLRRSGIACAIFGGAALASGVVFSVLVDRANRDVNDRTRTDVVPASAVSDSLHDGPRYETLQWIAYGVGAAAALAGGTLYYFGVRAAAGAADTPRVAPLVYVGGVGAVVRTSF